MLTDVQKETLLTLINLYQSSNGKSIKGVEIADTINRNPGTIRNQMISLRRLGFVKSVCGPGGGYKPTMEAYHSLNIPISDKDYQVPIFKNDKQLEELSVAKIEFTSIPQQKDCEAAIKIIGNIKEFNIGDEIRIGPTPVNNLGITGKIVGKDDLDNILLIDTHTIRSIPKITVGDIATKNIISFNINDSLKEAANYLSNNGIDGGPVLHKGEIVGIFTVNELIQAIANDNENKTVGEIMSTDIITINKDLKIANAIELIINESISRLIIIDNNKSLVGIVTITDLIESITNFNNFPFD